MISRFIRRRLWQANNSFNQDAFFCALRSLENAPVKVDVWSARSASIEQTERVPRSVNANEAFEGMAARCLSSKLCVYRSVRGENHASETRACMGGGGLSEPVPWDQRPAAGDDARPPCGALNRR